MQPNEELGVGGIYVWASENSHNCDFPVHMCTPKTVYMANITHFYTVLFLFLSIPMQEKNELVSIKCFHRWKDFHARSTIFSVLALSFYYPNFCSGIVVIRVLYVTECLY